MGKIARSAISARVLKAMGIFSGLHFLSILCGIVRTKLVAMWIGPAGVGVISLYNYTMDTIKSVVTLNLRQSAMPEITHGTAEQKAEIGYATVHTALFLGLCGAVLTVLLSPLLSRLAFGSYDYSWGFAALAPTVLFATMADARSAFLQGLDRLGELARAAMWSTLLSTLVAIPLFYFFRMSAIVPVLVIYGLATFAFLAFPRLPKPSKTPSMEAVVATGKRFAKRGAFITMGVFVGVLAEYLLRIFITSQAGEAGVGVFQSGSTIINSYVGIIFAAITMEFFPRLSATIDRRHITGVIVGHEISMAMWILLPVVVVFLAADELVVRILYSEEFLTVLPYLSVAILGVFYRIVAWCFSYVILAKGDGKMYILTETSSAASLLLLSCLGWHFGGFWGLGLAYVGQHMIFTFTTTLAYRHYGLRISKKMWQLLALATVIGGAALGLRLVAWWLPLVAVLPWLLPLSLKKILR